MCCFGVGFGLVCGFILGFGVQCFLLWFCAYPNSPFYRVLLFLVSVFGGFTFACFFFHCPEGFLVISFVYLLVV